MADEKAAPESTPASNPNLVPMRVPGKAGITWVHPDEVVDTLNKHGTVLSPEEESKIRAQERYGTGIGSELKAFGLGAAREATFGLSDVGLTQTGLMAPSEVAGYKEANPGATMLGQAAGIVGSMALPGPNLVKGVSKIGGLAERGAAKLVGEGAESLLGRVAQRALPLAAAGATEGALYEAGHLLSEAALGDPNINAERVLSQIGLAALIGGGGMGVLGAGIELAQPAVAAARAALTKLSELPKNFGEVYPGIAAKLTGESASDISKIMKQQFDEVVADPAARTALVNKFASDVQDLGQSVRTLQKEFSTVRQAEREATVAAVDPEKAVGQLQNLYNKVEDAVAAMKAEPELFPARYVRKAEQLEEQMLRKAQDLSGNPSEIYNLIEDAKGFIQKEVKFDKLASGATADAENLFKGLSNDLKVALEDSDVWGLAGTRQARINAAINDAITQEKRFNKFFGMKDVGKNGRLLSEVDARKLEKMLVQEGKGSAFGTKMREVFDDYIASRKKLVDVMEESFNATGEALPGEARAGMRAVDDSAANLRKFDDELAATEAQNVEAARLRKLESDMNAQATQSTLIDNATGTSAFGYALGAAGLGPVAPLALGATSLVSAGSKFLRNPRAVRATLQQLQSMGEATSKAIATGSRILVNASSKAAQVSRGEIAAGLASEFGKDKDAHEKLFAKRVDQIDEFTSNMEAMQNALELATKDLHESAPDISQAMQIKTLQGMLFLQSKIPRAPKTGLKPMKWVPSKAEISKFGRYYTAVEKPLSILKQAAAGTLTEEGVEAVQTVYPELFAEIQASIAETLAEHPNKEIPYRNRLMLSMIMGQPMDETTSAASIIASQATYQQPQQGQPNPSAANLTVANRAATPTQAAASRKA